MVLRAIVARSASKERKLWTGNPSSVKPVRLGCHRSGREQVGDGLPVHSFRFLLADLATMARNTITTAITPNYPFTVVTRPGAEAFDLLEVGCSQ